MEIEYNISEVLWCYNGEDVKYQVEGVEYATEDNGMIYIEINNNVNYEYHYVNLEGKLIISYTEGSEKISLFDLNMNEKVIKIAKKIHEVALGGNGDIYILAGDEKEKKLLVYSPKGEEISEYFPPTGYTFYRIGEIESEVIMVCQGNSSTQDNFGRNDWNFVLDSKNACWEKQSLAY